jgi:predicted membrane protein
MRNQGQLMLGLVVVVFGVALLVGNLLDVDLWALLWPSALILLGLWVLLRPQLVGSDVAVRQKLLGSIRRSGAWQVSDEEFWLGIGDVKLDLTEAEIPTGETRLRAWNFVGDVRLDLPEDVGVSLNVNALVVDARMFGKKRESFLVPVNMTSDDYETAERRIRLETTGFVGDVRVRRKQDV